MSKLDDRNAAIKLVQSTKPEKAANLAAARLALTLVNTDGKKRSRDRHKPGYMADYMRKQRSSKKAK